MGRFASQQVAGDWAKKLNATVTVRPNNLGVEASIVKTVTELCAAYGRIIVVEDDFVLNPDYIRYMLEGLDRYEHEPQVFQISGYMFPVEFPAGQDAFFMPFTTAWGWATWARAWKFFEWSPPGMTELLADSEQCWQFNLRGGVNYTKMIKSELEQPHIIYDVMWQYAVFRQKGLVAHPRRSLVWNGGMDGSGSFSSNDPKFPQISRELMSVPAFGEQIVWPQKAALDEAVYELLTMTLRERRMRKPSLPVRAWHKIQTFGSKLKTMR